VSRLHIRPVNLRKWFPENDSLATQMARLCILREDFAFELQGFLGSTSVPANDEYGVAWRQLYFFRRMCHAAREAQSVIERLSQDAAFKRFLRRRHPTFVKDFKKFKKDLAIALDIIETIGDEIAAHVKELPMKQALQSMSDQRSGFLQVSSEGPRGTHYKFTGELLMSVMFREIPSEQQETVAIERADRFIKAVEKLLLMIDMIFISYAKERGLIA